VSGALKRPITAATFHCGITVTAVIGRFKNTHPLTPGKKQIKLKLVASHSLAIGGRAPKKMLPMGIPATIRRPRRGLQQSTLT
jgi:hypothetical protein